MTTLMPFVVPALCAAALSFGLTPLVGRLAVRIGAIDMPGERKIHKSPVPRLGGLAVVAAIAIVLAALQWFSSAGLGMPAGMMRGLVLGVLPILAVSLVDDVRSLTARTKFIAHLAGAGIAVACGISLGSTVHLFATPIGIGYLALPLSVLWIVGVTNAFNIIDGLDGLSAGLALISAASIAAVFALVGQPAMSGVALVLCGALIGFLPYNVYPARLFLGDTGATSIGFCLAAFTLKGGSTLSTGFAALLPVFMLGLPIADTLIAMARRTLAESNSRKTAMFVPDRNHIHHRLLALGVDHGRAVVILYGAGLILASAAFLSMFMRAREAALFLVAILLAGFVGLHRLGYDEFAFLRRGTVLKVYEMPAVKRGMFVVFADLFLTVASAYLAVSLKTDTWGFDASGRSALALSAFLAPVAVLVFWKMGLYRGSWKFAGAQEYTRAAAAVSTVAVIGAVLAQWFSEEQHSASLLVIFGVVNLVLVLASRASHAVLLHTKLRARTEGTPVLIYGAGHRGVAAANELFASSRATLRPVGFVDDDPQKNGRILNGLPVLGSIRDLPAAVRSSGAEALLVSTPAISTHLLKEASERSGGLTVFRLNVKFERLAGRTLVQNGQASAVVAGRAHAAPASIPAPVFAPQAGAARQCPSCSATKLHRSKCRTLYERLRKLHTERRPFRCHDCGWRGWLVPLEYGTNLEVIPEAVNLSSLDTLFDDRLAVAASDD